MRVWERGTGVTMACGTGTCATVVAAILNGLVKKKQKSFLMEEIFIFHGRVIVLRMYL